MKNVFWIIEQIYIFLSWITSKVFTNQTYFRMKLVPVFWLCFLTRTQMALDTDAQSGTELWVNIRSWRQEHLWQWTVSIRILDWCIRMWLKHFNWLSLVKNLWDNFDVWCLKVSNVKVFSLQTLQSNHITTNYWLNSQSTICHTFPVCVNMFLLFTLLLKYFLSILKYFSDFPRVTIGHHNPLKIEEGDTAVLNCQVENCQVKTDKTIIAEPFPFNYQKIIFNQIFYVEWMV